MIVFVIALFVAEFTGHPGHSSATLVVASLDLTNYSGFVNGCVLGVFMFGGWEASVYLAEEGTDVGETPEAGIIAVVFCIVWLVILAMAIQAIAPAEGS